MKLIAMRSVKIERDYAKSNSNNVLRNRQGTGTTLIMDDKNKK